MEFEDILRYIGTKDEPRRFDVPLQTGEDKDFFEQVEGYLLSRVGNLKGFKGQADRRLVLPMALLKEAVNYVLERRPLHAYLDMYVGNQGVLMGIGPEKETSWDKIVDSFGKQGFNF